MSGFSADWLALREPADRRARESCAALLETLGSGGGTAPRDVLDLGAGTGANFRYLSPRLPGAQRWTLVDHDAALLEVALARTRAAPPALPGRAPDAAEPAPPATRVVDLVTGLAALPMPRGALVTASALLDLVSPAWLDALADRCREAHAQVLFALTYDGRARAWPAEPDDAAIVARLNRHQRTDKGFGPALGPAAAAVAATRFARAGYRLQRARSDWQIDASEPALQAALLEGWARAAREIDPGAHPQVDDWLRRRLRHLERGRSRLSVGHEDLAGVPAD